MLRKTKFLGREQWRRTYFSFSPQLQFTDGKSGQNLQVGTKKGKRISKPQSHCNMEKEPLHFKSPHRQRNTVPSPGVSPAS